MRTQCVYCFISGTPGCRSVFHHVIPSLIHPFIPRRKVPHIAQVVQKPPALSGPTPHQQNLLCNSCFYQWRPAIRYCFLVLFLPVCTFLFTQRTRFLPRPTLQFSLDSLRYFPCNCFWVLRKFHVRISFSRITQFPSTLHSALHRLQ